MKIYTTFFIVTLFVLTANAQERPFIWIKQSEHEAILEKI